MKLFDVLKKTNKAEKEIQESTIRGDVRHAAVDERLAALETEVKRLDTLIKTKKDK